MSSTMSASVRDKKDTLELYLNDLYEKECVFKIDSHEINFIQTGIESLIQRIVDCALKHFAEQEKYVGIPLFSESLSETFRKFRDSNCPSEIIKVGSFYEGTKNKFPDEFDFIFLLYCSENVSTIRENNLTIEDHARKLMMPLTNAILGLANVTEKNKQSLRYGDQSTGREIYFDKYVYAKGPAAKLRFIYNGGSCNMQYIDVDLVPAVRESGEIVGMAVEKICCQKEFRSEIMSTGSYIFVNACFANFSFTETEVRFMKTVMSPRHLKVYRILKYLINGHGDDEEMKNYQPEEHTVETACKLYSSYRIKTMLIYHHYECANGDQTGLGPCLLNILDKMSTCSHIDTFPKLVDKIDSFKTNKVHVGHSKPLKPFFFMDMREHKMGPLPYLHVLIHHLKTLQHSDDNYDYERDQVRQSVTKMYFENLSSERVIYERVQFSLNPLLH